MANTAQDFIEAIDNASDYADAEMDKLAQTAREDIDELYRNSEVRSEELWGEFNVDVEATLDEYDAEETRGLDWVLGLSGLAAASAAQFFLDERERTIIRPAAYRLQLVDGFDLGRDALVVAGKRGFEVVGRAKFEALKAKYLERVAFMRDLTDVELYERLASYGGMRSTEQLVADASRYVSRMTNYRPGSAQFKQEVASLIDVSSTRNLKAMNRRATSQIYAVEQVGGDLKKKMVWIVEGGKNTCDFCLARAGDVATYEEWISDGLPGGDVCLGGDSCRCVLAAY